jgi:hypothetical protein
MEHNRLMRLWHKDKICREYLASIVKDRTKLAKLRNAKRRTKFFTEDEARLLYRIKNGQLSLLLARRGLRVPAPFGYRGHTSKLGLQLHEKHVAPLQRKLDTIWENMP